MRSLRAVFDVAGLTALAAVALCGPLLTALAPVSASSWVPWLSIRLALQTASGAWGGIGVAGLARLDEGAKQAAAVSYYSLRSPTSCLLFLT